MNTDFIIKALDDKYFSQYLQMNEEQLARVNGCWLTADETPGYPCRVTLQEAEVGEKILLIHYPYHDVKSPYRATGPIFVRANKTMVELAINEIPEILQTRLLSVRAYDVNSMMVHAETVQGPALEDVIRNNFKNDQVHYLQIHNGNPGCFNCSVFRA
ncbi:DUF1203 domain-containing protein [Vibrio ruber]|uniref:DUF1203 domain-containing protein n=1 Tax=Vibrio ruber TaxID=184755 RepID=UPI002892EEEE|nr:DUF1203 domain-containing protein [Vibrio ruber]WNJ94884.1 DUF1203 domain-containing protein [Vibrio ruber]